MNLTLKLTGAIVTSLIAFIPTSPVALSQIHLEDFAKQVTVRVYQDNQTSGSGFIIKRVGDNYTVLTCAHVVAVPGQYKIKTAQGKEYTINSDKIKQLPNNLDLAIAEFSSKEDYSQVPLAEQNPKLNDAISVSGWLNPLGGISQPTYNFIVGRITSILDTPEKGGYTIIYNAGGIDQGMSGGPVLNSNGQVVAINGRAASSDTGKTGLFLGIPIQSFLQYAAQIGVNVSAGNKPENVNPINTEPVAVPKRPAVIPPAENIPIVVPGTKP